MINLGFRAITLNHTAPTADWLPRMVDFFTSSPSPAPSPLPDPAESAKAKPAEPEAPAEKSTVQLHVDFDEFSVLYIPPHPLSSRLVLYVEDLRLHITEFSPLSLNIHSNNWKVLLWDGMHVPNEIEPWHDGYPVICLSYIILF